MIQWTVEYYSLLQHYYSNNKLSRIGHRRTFTSALWKLLDSSIGTKEWRNINTFILSSQTKARDWGVVVAQVVDRSLPTPEVHCSNPVIGKNLYWMLTVSCIEKTKKKIKETGNGLNSLDKILSDIHLFTVNFIKKTKMKKKEAGNGHNLNMNGVALKYTKMINVVLICWSLLLSFSWCTFRE